MKKINLLAINVLILVSRRIRLTGVAFTMLLAPLVLAASHDPNANTVRTRIGSRIRPAAIFFDQRTAHYFGYRRSPQDLALGAG